MQIFLLHLFPPKAINSKVYFWSGECGRHYILYLTRLSGPIVYSVWWNAAANASPNVCSLLNAWLYLILNINLDLSHHVDQHQLIVSVYIVSHLSCFAYLMFTCTSGHRLVISAGKAKTLHLHRIWRRRWSVLHHVNVLPFSHFDSFFFYQIVFQHSTELWPVFPHSLCRNISYWQHCHL